MAQLLGKDFVESRISSLSGLPDSWGLDSSRYFKLDLKMCRLRSLLYGFEWGSDSYKQERFRSSVEMPTRVVSLDLSLNELSALAHDGLAPLPNVRSIDSSLNRVSSVVGIELLKELRYLNLAHNVMSRVDLIPSCPSLLELNLSMNQITSLTALPNLRDLTVLNLSSNQLTSLDGVQSLGRLRELFVQDNQLTDLIAVSGCLHLVTLNAAHNKISTLKSVVEVLGRLRALRVLTLKDNPIERLPSYQKELLQGTSIVSLDSISIRPHLKQPVPGTSEPGLSENMLNISDLTRRVYEDQIRAERAKMEENVSFLQSRILSIQSGFEEYENKMRSDLDLCLQHLEGLSSAQLATFDSSQVGHLLSNPRTTSWQQKGNGPMAEDSSSQKQKPNKKSDYTGVKDTDEVLRLANLELSRNQRQDTI